MLQVVPPEIIDQIIDFAHDDPDTLQACSLTSSAWLSSSQRHFFSSITVINSHVLSKFIQLITHTSRIACYVQDLRINARQSSDNPRLQHWILDIISLPIGNLTRLTTLRFEHVQWNFLCMGPRFLAGLEQFTCVNELHIYACTFFDLFDFETLVVAIPSLSKLCVDLLSWYYYKSDPAKPGFVDRCRLRLSSVELKRYSAPSVLSTWLLQTPCISSLREVALDWIMPSEEKAVGTFLQRLGPSLHHLRIGCRIKNESDTAAASLLEYIDLSHNTELLSLHFIIDDLQDLSISWVPALLSQVNNGSIKQITFELVQHSVHNLHQSPWVEVARILSEQNFATIRDVVFILENDLKNCPATEFLTGQFHDLVTRRILAIQTRFASLGD